ncbi:MAG: hypothetical protein UT48_C0007G0022 [Parcubacteria group bacterium GW2011_GWE2_39_37]|nr:MAG: hypothetical protein UT48_C0007G0022 [Parcubacteria group bacterium GW2011_GWE2_39_37]
MVQDFNSDPYGLVNHLKEMEKWAHFMIEKYPDVEQEIVLLSVWLHDIGHYPLPTDQDHAVRGEERARKFLEDHNYDDKKIEKVLHCVRAHRCRDVMPETKEAKIIAFIDSASHMTDTMYLDIVREDKNNKAEPRVFAKMERDFRDLSWFPEVQKDLSELYDSWKKLLEAYQKIDFN